MLTISAFFYPRFPFDDLEAALLSMFSQAEVVIVYRLSALKIQIPDYSILPSLSINFLIKLVLHFSFLWSLKCLWSVQAMYKMKLEYLTMLYITL